MRTTLIPIELCQFVLRKKLSKPFQLYIALKLQCDGIIRIGKQDRMEIASQLGLKSIKTIDSNLQKLIELNWIGHNKVTGWYFIRSYNRLNEKYGFNRRLAAEFRQADIKILKPFIIGAVIGSLIISQKRKSKAVEPTRGGSVQVALDFFPVANDVLVKILKIRKSTACSYKKLANKHGFIKIVSTFKDTKILAKHIRAFRMANPETNAIAIKKNKTIVFRGIDHVMCLVNFRRRKKTNYIEREGR